MLQDSEECFEGASRVFQEVSKVIQSSFIGASRVFQEYFKKVKGCFKCFNDVS